MPSFRLSTGHISVRPAAELRHLRRHYHERHVPGALLPFPCPEPTVEPCPARMPARCLRCGRPPPPACRPAPRPVPNALLSTLDRARRRSTSR
eukprot:scaffold34462_cov56-Phaeocystis_antarctica.AAC.8